MFELFLNRYAAVSADGEEILSAEELSAWPQEDVFELKRFRLLRKASPAKSIECPGCEEACLMPVHVYLAQDGRPARIFIACDKREDTGRVLIESADLERWQLDISRFARLLTLALDAGDEPVEIIPHHAFYLGALTIHQKRRSAFFVPKSESLKDVFDSSLFEEYPNAFVLVGSGQAGVQEAKQGLVIPLLHVLLPSKDELKVDVRGLQDLLSQKSRERQDVIPLRVPEDTKWNQVFISFVNDQAVQIKVAGIVENRTFDSMGFSDLRAGPQESRPSPLWGIFRQMAVLNGEMTCQEPTQNFEDPMKMKKWVSEIRKKLRVVFPDIQGDPFHQYKKVNGYKTRFALNTSPSFL